MCISLNRAFVNTNKTHNKAADRKVIASKNSNAAFLRSLSIPFCVFIEYASADEKA
jgi:hypothetical protein